jgi:hypothetical protein
MKQVFSLLVCCLLILVPSSVKATHLMGGEITWECMGNGTYVFTMKLYRDCNGVQLQFPIALRVHNHPSVSSIEMSLESQRDISPQCNGSGPTISCQTGGNGAVQEFILKSSFVNLPGVPPPQGWIFTFDDCCRNLAISNLVINPGTGFTLRAIMYASNGSSANPCYDSSPVFAQFPATIICAGNPFTYNHNAYDPDLDSLSYSFAQPLDWLNGGAYSGNIPALLPFQIAYSVNSPFPGPGQNNSIPATLNSETGEISFRPNYTGNFATVVGVKSYRCGILLAEIFREIQVVVLNCGINNPPTITAPFVNTGTGLQTSFTDTVQAGDLASFTITATDNEFLPIGGPQTIRVTASGGQFGSGFTNANAGCSNPPCATLLPAPPVVLPNNGTVTFNWQTTCDHVAILDECYDPISTYTFVLTFQDDFCPAPSYRIATVTIFVKAPPVIDPPSLRCLEVLPNGDVKLSWIPPADTGNLFNSYHIFSSNSLNGPYTIVDSLFSIAQSSYTHVGAGANLAPRFYLIRSRSGCAGRAFSRPSDSLQTIFIAVTDAGSGNINLNWNPLSAPLPPTTVLPYQIKRQLIPNGFSNYGTTNQLDTVDFITGCFQTLNYFITVPDLSGCTSVSNVDGGIFSNDEPPESPNLDSISVNNANNSVYIGWIPSVSADTRGYLVYRLENGVIVNTDTVFGVNASFFEAMSANPESGSVSYAIVAFDNCGNISNQTEVHSSMFFQTSLSSCENKVELNWSPYRGWTAIPSNYRILVAINGAAFTVELTVAGNSTSTTISDLIPGANYCIKIQAVDATGILSSTSNDVCFNADVENIPDFLYLRRSTVLDDGTAFSTCYFDTTGDSYFYKIVRKSFPQNVIDTLLNSPIPIGSNYLNYTDLNALTSSTSYTYYYLLLNKCNEPSLISNPGRTIYLEGAAGEGFFNRLKWNNYIDWDAGVEKYLVFRSLNGGNTYDFLADNGLDTTFTDNVIDEVDTLMQFCYYVEAVENAGNQFGFRDSSTSNKICVTQEPTIYIPNTFRPASFGKNASFKPLGLYEKLATNLEFRIFNRWGEQLFFTIDALEAWDGKYLSRIVQSGIYTYRISFSLPGGSKFNKIGAVLVLD